MRNDRSEISYVTVFMFCIMLVTPLIIKSDVIRSGGETYIDMIFKGIEAIEWMPIFVILFLLSIVGLTVSFILSRLSEDMHWQYSMNGCAVCMILSFALLIFNQFF